ncbi:hypothetical protein DMH04_26170 [Kibdelosporangium aridum]|uniref:CU044_5270 family protein n=1 Tax=Kibdelosporangium aridum TaxID=2030 RepID=A0A428Z5N1_KIBAR|nr:hypothetical protein [Kibdelosporangium aridum]RSM82173.1 hypothetical protein DMH04_26170 [Kibdelosporangium aridum]
MNDVELDEALAGFRDDVPEMTEDAFLIGKLRLQAAAEPALEPLPEPEPLTVVRLDVGDPSRRRSPPRRRRLIPWLTAAAAVLVAVGTTVALRSNDHPPAAGPSEVKKPYPKAPQRPARIPSAKRGAPLPPVGVVYNAAGELTASDLPQQPGQYLTMGRYEWGIPTVVRGDVHGGLQMDSEGFWEEWVPADRSGVWRLVRDVDTRRANTREQDEPQWPTMVSGLSYQEGTFEAAKGEYFPPARGSWTQPTEEFIANLPRDPRELYTRLAADASETSDPPGFAVQLAGSLLNRPVPADVRRAIYQALSYHPWIRVSTDARTRDGRAAVSLTIDNLETTRSVVLLVDPANGLLIGTREIRMVDDFPDARAGSVAGETTTHWAVVNGIGN